MKVLLEETSLKIKKKGEDLSIKRDGNCGRKHASTPRQGRKLVAMCKENRSASSKMLAAEWKLVGVQASPATVRRRLAEKGFRACRPVKIPKLTLAMMSKILAWAKAH